MSFAKKYPAKRRRNRMVSIQGQENNYRQIDATVYNFIKSLKLLKHKHISLTHISRSLKLSHNIVADSIQRLQQNGLKIRRV